MKWTAGIGWALAIMLFVCLGLANGAAVQKPKRAAEIFDPATDPMQGGRSKSSNNWVNEKYRPRLNSFAVHVGAIGAGLEAGVFPGAGNFPG